MKKKLNNLKWFSLGLAICLLLTTTIVPASAAFTQRQATLLFDNIRVTLDGQEIIPRDAVGNVVEPFIIDGTTYLPVRGIASALGLDVNWEASTRTVILRTGQAPTPPPNTPQSHDWGNSSNDRIVWLANSTSLIAHSISTCSGMRSPVQSTRGAVIQRGGRPCQNCWTNR